MAYSLHAGGFLLDSAMTDMDDGGQAVAGADAARLGAVVAAERASAEHWRVLALQRAAALAELKQRPIVRAALALDRHSARPRARAAAAVARLRRTEQRGALLLGAVASRRHRSNRRAELAGAVAQVRAVPPETRTRSLVVVASGVRTPSKVGQDPPTGPVTETITVWPSGDGPSSGGSGRTVQARDGETLAGAAARAIEDVHTDLVCLLATSTEPLTAGWLDRLSAAVSADVVAATPVVLHPWRPLDSATGHDLRIRSAGLVAELIDGGTPVMRSRMAGGAPELSGSAVAVPAATAACLVIDRASYAAVGGLGPFADLDAAVIELCMRFGASGQQIVCVPTVAVFDHRPVTSRAELTRPLDEAGSAWRTLVDLHGPAFVRTALGRGDLDGAGRSAGAPRVRFAISVATPSPKVAQRWGDWHFGEALAESLRRLGHEVLLQTAKDADSPPGRSCDVHIVLRGVRPVRRTPGQCHVLWVISHPEAVETSECDEADLVLVASTRFAEELRRRTATPVEALLQATDPDRFRPRQSDPDHEHPVTVVAKSRDVLRPIVADAIAAGLRPAIYGGGWRNLVESDLVVAEHVPNDVVPVVYSSAGVVLNDHWDTMRAWGFVSNRIFDVLACGAPLISDHLPEIIELFGDTVVTSSSPQELRTAVDAALADPVGARERAARGRSMVLDAHTFDHRARAVLALLGRHGLVPAQPSTTEGGQPRSPEPGR